ncbi:hypothetical protein EVAR_94664_1 [Eumeta japonica]|uniref:Uncharacterized protein n=1 Tax=Eumeta variegata TaxID=151549 RepID=A0A4C1UVK1_EUMVA|nr:hypothetical protein EVAR_94664_1 [Eumeta japonica]
MGVGEHLLSDGPHARLPLINPIKEKKTQRGSEYRYIRDRSSYIKEQSCGGSRVGGMVMASRDMTGGYDPSEPGLCLAIVNELQPVEN